MFPDSKGCPIPCLLACFVVPRNDKLWLVSSYAMDSTELGPQPESWLAWCWGLLSGILAWDP